MHSINLPFLNSTSFDLIEDTFDTLEAIDFGLRLICDFLLDIDVYGRAGYSFLPPAP